MANPGAPPHLPAFLAATAAAPLPTHFSRSVHPHCNPLPPIYGLAASFTHPPHHPPARPPGNGTKGSDYRGGKGGAAQALNSPWDLSLDPSEGQVYIAMAGQHQLWRYDVASGVAGAQGI